MTDTGTIEISEDALLKGRVRFLQPVTGYRAAIDPVLLAATAPAEPGMKVLDLGCGAGAIALCLLARVPELEVHGLEAAPEMLDLARRNAALNCWETRFLPMGGRVEALPDAFARGDFDLVVTNPPYLDAVRADPSESALKSAAHIEAEAVPADWIEAAYKALRHKGHLAMVQRADRLGDLLPPLARRFGGIEIHPLYPKLGRDARRVILRARKGVRTPLTLSAGLVLHNMDGSFAPEVAAALEGAALGLGTVT